MGKEDLGPHYQSNLPIIWLRKRYYFQQRATLILLKPSHFNCAALLSRCAASSKSITPYVKENNMGFKDNDQEAVLVWSEQ